MGDAVAHHTFVAERSAALLFATKVKMHGKKLLGGVTAVDSAADSADKCADKCSINVHSRKRSKRRDHDSELARSIDHQFAQRWEWCYNDIMAPVPEMCC